jgi:hypothetical protein
MRTFLAHISLKLYFAWREYWLKREPDFAYYQHLFVPLSRPWQELISLNTQLKRYSITILGLGAITSFLIFIQYYQLFEHSFILLIISGLGISFLILKFSHLLQQSKIWQEKFTREVAERKFKEQSVDLNDYQRQIIRKNHFWATWRSIKLTSVMVGLSLISLYVLSEIKRYSFTKPQNLSAIIKTKIKRHEANILKIKANRAKNQQTAQQARVKINVNEKMILMAEHSIKEQYNGLFQSNGFKTTLVSIRQRIEFLRNQGQSTIQIEQNLKQDAQIWAQIKGLVEVRLSILDEEVSQAEAQLNQEGETLKAFQDLTYIYHRMQEKAQSGIFTDNKKIKRLKAEVDWQKCLLEKIDLANRQDSILIVQHKQDILNHQKKLKTIQNTIKNLSVKNK